MSQSQSELLDARYGRARNRRRDRAFAIAIATVAVVGFGAWSVGNAIWQATAVSASVTGYKVLSSNQMSVDLQLARPDNRAVTCNVRALSADFAVVGFKSITFAAGSSPSPALVGILVNTTHEAVSADTKDCHIK